MVLRLCYEGEVVSDNVDIKLTSTVYNLCYWISRDYSYIYLPGEPLTLVELQYNGMYKLYSISCESVDEMVRKLEFTIGLKEDLSEFFEIGRKDPLLGLFVEEYRGLRLRSTSLWMGLLTGICQQNASFVQGWRMLHRVVSTYGRAVDLGHGKVVLRPPTPSEVLSDVDRLLVAGVGYRVKGIVNVAKTLQSGKLSDEVLERRPEEIEEVLTDIKGVGPYTARLAIALTTRRYELPPVDRWLKKIASIAYAVDENYVEEYWVERWGKWSALAAITTTIALDAEPLQKAIERTRKRELLPKLDRSPSPVNMIGFCK